MAASAKTTSLSEAEVDPETSAAAIKTPLTAPAKAILDNSQPAIPENSQQTRLEASSLQIERSSPSFGSLPSVPEDLPTLGSCGMRLRSPVRSTSSSRRLMHQMSIDRSVENECIIVDEGYVNEPGDAASTASESHKDVPPGLSRFAMSAVQGLAGASEHDASMKTRLGSTVEAVRSGSIPPESPFGQLCFQEHADFQEEPLTVEEAEARLAALHLPAPLMSGLRSLSGSELAVYMQLTEELRSEDLAELASSVRPDPSEGSSSGEKLNSAEEEDRLENAVRRLKQLLPQSAIDELSSHNSYGLMDMLHSQPLTPPSTPTAATDS